ncbi:AraC family transcriptional regulator [Flagellimonas allohymeniacidonis]|uniref:AraC family transcriptional regulator n=1 Tax=Flagellimonas allohymeniacidonis TaxID=2517819 RepID=A0A4Q8QJ85_9FLAO|nr:helix-turn-helix domain-containing protein [Allomuricauda hymeniacidonis]TAI48529.1 AraC family transcriptional regulator [Allomuricauda hymeniacidonis]
MIDIWSIAIIVFAVQGLFVLFSLLTSAKRRTKKEGLFLILIVIVLLWYLIEFLFVRNKINVGLNIFYGTRYGSWLVLGPLAYYYFKSITEHEWRFSSRNWVHFLPFALCVLFIPLILENTINDRQVHYGMLSVFDHREKVIAPIQYFYSVIFIAQFLHLGTYLYSSLKLVTHYKSLLKTAYAQIHKKVNWLSAFLIVFIFILVFTSLFLFILFKTDIYRRHLDYLYVMPIGLLFYMIGFYLIDVNWETVDKKMVKYANSSLDKEKLESYIIKLDGLMIDEQVYMNPEIRLKDLAGKMDISTHHLSQIINENYESSFFDFINKHRIKMAKKRIAENPSRLLIDIAFECGFNNKTSFVNAFKKFEKMTPSKFRDTHFS